jgi:hypothetical protein
VDFGDDITLGKLTGGNVPMLRFRLGGLRISCPLVKVSAEAKFSQRLDINP